MKHMMTAGIGLGLMAALSACSGKPAEPETPVRVAIITDMGGIAIEVDTKQAPDAACAFLKFAADGGYEGGAFFRSVRSNAEGETAKPVDIVEARAQPGPNGAGHAPIKIGRPGDSPGDSPLKPVAGSVSLVRTGEDMATPGFFIVTADSPALDRGGAENPDGRGFTGVGSVVEGMDVVQRIHGWTLAEGDSEQLSPPVLINVARLSGEMPARCLKKR